jgi:hypothetical protein
MYQNDSEEPEANILLQYRGHQMGANAIDAVLLKEKGACKIRVCSGGDDQSIFCCDISVSNGIATMDQSVKLDGVALSAIRGIRWVTTNRFVATGYDQKLRLFESDGSSTLVCLASQSVDVGDVNCLDYSDIDRHGYVAVGGAGVELFQLSKESCS